MPKPDITVSSELLEFGHMLTRLLFDHKSITDKKKYMRNMGTLFFAK